MFQTILNIFEGKNVELKKFNFFFPELRLMDLKGLIKLILNQKSYFIKVNQIIRKMKIDLRNQQNNNINDKDQIKSKNDKKKMN